MLQPRTTTAILVACLTAIAASPAQATEPDHPSPNHTVSINKGDNNNSAGRDNLVGTGHTAGTGHNINSGLQPLLPDSGRVIDLQALISRSWTALQQQYPQYAQSAFLVDAHGNAPGGVSVTDFSLVTRWTVLYNWCQSGSGCKVISYQTDTATGQSSLNLIDDLFLGGDPIPVQPTAQDGYTYNLQEAVAAYVSSPLSRDGDGLLLPVNRIELIQPNSAVPPADSPWIEFYQRVADGGLRVVHYDTRTHQVQ